MYVRRSSTDASGQEYGGDFRRLYPWADVVTPPWGSAWMTIAPGSGSIPHQHDECETFVILSGTGTMSVDGETEAVQRGDVIYLPRFSQHRLENTSTTAPLELLCIWWGAPEASIAQ